MEIQQKNLASISIQINHCLFSLTLTVLETICLKHAFQSNKALTKAIIGDTIDITSMYE